MQNKYFPNNKDGANINMIKWEVGYNTSHSLKVFLFEFFKMRHLF